MASDQTVHWSYGDHDECGSVLAYHPNFKLFQYGLRSNGPTIIHLFLITVTRSGFEANVLTKFKSGLEDLLLRFEFKALNSLLKCFLGPF